MRANPPATRPSGHATALAVIAIGGFATDFVLNVGLGRLLPAHEYGDFKVAYAFLAFFGVAVLLGGDRAAPKVLAAPLSRGETAEAWEYLRFYLLTSLGLSALVIGGAWAGSLLLHGTARADEHHPVAWMSLGVPLYAASALASRALQSAKLPLRAALPPRVGAPLLLLGLLATAGWALGSIDLPTVVLLALLSIAVLLAFEWSQVRLRALPRLDRDSTLSEPRRWLATSVPMMAVFLVTLALHQDDLYFLELLGEEHEVGHYGAATTVAHFLALIQVTVIGLIAPLVEPALEGGEAAVKSVRLQGRRLMLWGLLPVAVVLLATAPEVLSLFGEGYTHAAPALQLLVVANGLWAAAALPMLWLHYTGRGKHVVAITATSLVVDSILNVWLIPLYGIRGAAGGTLVTTLLASAAIIVLERRSQ